MSDTEHILHPVAITQVMVNFAATFGVETDTCIAGTGISANQLNDSEALITRDQEMNLLENLILALPDESALGFKLGLQYSVSTFGAWGFALRTSRTLREACISAIRYLPLSTAYCDMRHQDRDDEFIVTFDPSKIPLNLRQFLLERDMATGIKILQELSLTGIQFKRVEFVSDKPEHAEVIAENFGLEPVYSAKQNLVCLRVEDAEKPLPTYDAQLAQLMHEQCRKQLERRQQIGVTGKVRQQLLGELGLAATLEEIASALAMSERNLRRKLEAEGTTFKALLDDEKHQFAKKLLANSDMKLDEMTYQLGYTDSASFSRAFRRWQGCSPGVYRRTHSD